MCIADAVYIRERSIALDDGHSMFGLRIESENRYSFHDSLRNPSSRVLSSLVRAELGRD